MIMEMFESVVILKPTLSLKEFNRITLKLRDVLQDWNKTKRVFVEEVGKKKLAYPVEGYESGYFILFTFECHPAHIPEFQKLLQEDDNVLQFLTLKTDKDRDILADLPAPDAKSEQDSPEVQDVFNLPDLYDLIFHRKDT